MGGGRGKDIPLQPDTNHGRVDTGTAREGQDLK